MSDEKQEPQPSQPGQKVTGNARELDESIKGKNAGPADKPQTKVVNVKPWPEPPPPKKGK